MLNNIRLILIAALVILFLILLNIEKLSPDAGPFYGFKRYLENTYMGLKSTPSDKAEFYAQLLDRRLKELDYIVDRGKYGYVLKSSLRYSTTAGLLTELVNSNNLNENKPQLREKFIEHKKILKTILDTYPKDITDNVEWKYIVDDINYLDIYLGQLSEVTN